MAPVFYDTHAHLDYPELASEIPDILARATHAGITRIISIGTNLESSQRAVALAENYEQVFAAVGWHPSDVHLAPDDIRPDLRRLALHPKVVALGETGLDYYRLPGKTAPERAGEDAIIKQKQADLFRQHLEVAAETGLNCVIHQRESMEDALQQLAPFASRVRSVFHCFVDGAATLERILDLNSIVSFTGIVTFKNADVVRGSLGLVPFGKFMLETDSPFLAPVPYRGKRCEPAYVAETAKKVAELKGCSFDDLSRTTCDTAHKFFPKLSRPS